MPRIATIADHAVRPPRLEPMPAFAVLVTALLLILALFLVVG
jgi:hypothetical protein